MNSDETKCNTVTEIFYGMDFETWELQLYCMVQHSSFYSTPSLSS